MPIFLQNNTFELWAHDRTPLPPDECWRLLRGFDITVLFEGGSLVSWVIARIKVRGAIVTTNVEGKIWSFSQDGNVEVTGISKYEYHADYIFDDLEPSLKTLHRAAQGGHGIDIETLMEVQGEVDCISRN